MAAVRNFTESGLGLVRRANLRAKPASRRLAGETSPVPKTWTPNDDRIPAEHSSPENVSPDKPEEGHETFKHEVTRIDPGHYDKADAPGSSVEASVAKTDAKAGDDGEEEDGPFEPAVPLRIAVLHDELPQDAPPPAPKPLGAAPPDTKTSPSDSPPRDAPTAPVEPAADNPRGQPAPNGEPPAQNPKTPKNPATPKPPAAGDAPPTPPAKPGADAAPAGQGDPVFDFASGLDPAARGHLCNDWQEDVDNKLFSRHTNVVALNADGNTVKLTVQAYNTDTSVKADISTGYAADGQGRGELMMHIREVFQPNGPAITHVSDAYNKYIEIQADAGKGPMIRLKVVHSDFTFHASQRSIEGWGPDSGMGKGPQWQKTPYTVYTIEFMVTFALVGQAAPAPAAPAAASPAAPPPAASTPAPPAKPAPKQPQPAA